MNDKAEKVYAEAFFELCLEQAQDKLTEIAEELEELQAIFAAQPEFVKLLCTPTVSVEERVEIVKETAEKGAVSELCGNLMCVLAERGRFGCFGGIVKSFREMYNEHFKIAEIIVTTTAPLSEKVREQIKTRMSEVTGKTVSLREKVDPAIIGGIVIDHGSTRYDGSVKARLNALKNELGSIIA